LAGIEKEFAMNTNPNYPKFNDPPYTQRPVLAAYGSTPAGELIWMIIPVLVLALALIVR
jgi:hypothetical protein